jgi:uncharacterized membrane protein
MSGPAPFLPITPLIAAHVAAGLGAVLAGMVAMLVRKGGRWHRRSGLTYLIALIVLVLTGGVLALEERTARRDLFYLGLVALLLAVLGYGARWRRRDGWIVPHLLAMGGSYIVMLTAFYVDNGPRLPLWWRMPAWALWTLPSILGALLLARAVNRHRR